MPKAAKKIPATKADNYFGYCEPVLITRTESKPKKTSPLFRNPKISETTSITLTFDAALRFQIGLQQAILKLNSYNRRKVAGKNAALKISANMQTKKNSSERRYQLGITQVSIKKPIAP